MLARLVFIGCAALAGCLVAFLPLYNVAAGV